VKAVHVGVRWVDRAFALIEEGRWKEMFSQFALCAYFRSASV